MIFILKGRTFFIILHSGWDWFSDSRHNEAIELKQHGLFGVNRK